MKKLLSFLLTLCLSLGIFSSCGINKLKVGDIIEFGNYHGSFEDDKLSWEILYVKDDRMLILSEYIIDWKHFNDSSAYTTWNDSSIRQWLNGEFYHTAFSIDERERIIETTLENIGNYDYGINGSGDTKDKIFLLSTEEIEEFMGDGYEEWQAFPESYARDERNKMTNESFYSSYSRWWTRTPGESRDEFLCVDDGSVSSPGPGIFISKHASSETGSSKAQGAGVRPAMWISIENK